MKKAIVAGHICIDITPVFPEKKVNDISQLLVPGKLLHMAGVDIHTGGAVANTGLAMKLFGMDVALLGKVGNDEFGKMIAGILKSYQAETGLIVSDTAATSYSVVLAVPGIDRIFLHDPGANDTFVYEDIPQEQLQDIALFHFGYPTIMKSMYENNGAELIRIFKEIHARGIATSLDMAAVDEKSEAGGQDWEKILSGVLPYVDFFVPSAEELCFMLDKDKFQDWSHRAAGGDVTEILDIEKDIQPLAKRCIALGAKIVLIKCGVPGLYYCTADAQTLSQVGHVLKLDSSAWADKEGFEKSYLPDQVLSGTGAGDVSIAAFLSAVLEERTLEDCMHLAAAAGASCVTSYDALSGLKSLKELDEKIKGGWKKCW